MKDLADLLEIVKHETGASPIVAQLLLSIASSSVEVNANMMLTKLSSMNIEKVFRLMKKMKQSTNFYFEVIEKIQEEQLMLDRVSKMEGL